MTMIAAAGSEQVRQHVRWQGANERLWGELRRVGLTDRPALPASQAAPEALGETIADAVKDVPFAFRGEAAILWMARKIGVSVADLCGPSRADPLVFGRHQLFVYMADELSMSVSEIGWRFGRDRKTVMHGLEKLRGAAPAPDISGVIERAFAALAATEAQIAVVREILAPVVAPHRREPEFVAARVEIVARLRKKLRANDSRIAELTGMGRDAVRTYRRSARLSPVRERGRP